MLEELSKIYYEVTGNKDVQLTEKTSLDKDLQLSSLQKISLISAIEECFEIEIPNKKLKKFKKVGDIVSFLEETI